jgi:aspartate 1-decarboxylase
VNVALLKSKIHRATVTRTELDYVGSLTLDQDLMRAANLTEYEKILVVDIDNGARFETYCLQGPAGGGLVCVNGAAARLAAQGDKIIVMAFGWFSLEEAATHRPTVIFVDEKNRLVESLTAERHGPRP